MTLNILIAVVTLFSLFSTTISGKGAEEVLLAHDKAGTSEYVVVPRHDKAGTSEYVLVPRHDKAGTSQT
jgi:hypothetical protein